MLDIVNDFLRKNGVIVSVSIEVTKFDGYDKPKAQLISDRKDEFIYTILYDPEYWDNMIEPRYEHQIDYARDIVSTMLHEATHIICNHRGIESKDKSYDFEKLIYDNYLNSNYDNADGRFLSGLLGITREEYLRNYKKEREDKFFTKYINYVNYLMGYSSNL
ncbi:MAG: hypothetical protein [Bacteriophage sp.]|nr:MAG: hypothetical protein [Bacteriophage sp.]